MGSQSTESLNGLVIRVDDRLLHGQILYGWATAWADEVWLAHDRVATTPAERALYEEYLEGLSGGILTVDEAIARYQECGCEVDRCLLVVGSCDDLKRLIDGGVEPGEIHLANIGVGDEKVQIAETVNLSDEDCRTIRSLQQQGYSICLRKLPQSKTKPVEVPEA